MKQRLAIYFGLLLSLCGTISITPAIAKEPEVLKVKGLYLGMSVEEAVKIIGQLFGGKTIYPPQHRPIVQKEKLQLFPTKHYSLIYDDLVKSGYLNEKGEITDKITSAEKFHVDQGAAYAPYTQDEQGLMFQALNDYEYQSQHPLPFVADCDSARNETLVGATEQISCCTVDKKTIDRIVFKDVGRLFNAGGLPAGDFARNFMESYGILNMQPFALIEKNYNFVPEHKNGWEFVAQDYGYMVKIYTDPETDSVEKITLDVIPAKRSYKFD